MTTNEPHGHSSPLSYAVRLAGLVAAGPGQLFRAPTHSRRADARRRLARHWLWCMALGGAAILALMAIVDSPEIQLMPPRGTNWLWPVRILTDFGKAGYILLALAAVAIGAVILEPLFGHRMRSALVDVAARSSFLFLAVGIPVEAGEIIKGIVGRGRPFVGGNPDPFNYSHFAWTEAYASFPSGHANASFALAFAVTALWPRLAVLMWPYALAICATRLVLLAHHPSDVLAGALIGVIGAMFVRYWFAARHILFTIGSEGAIHPVQSRISPREGVADKSEAP